MLWNAAQRTATATFAFADGESVSRHPEGWPTGIIGLNGDAFGKQYTYQNGQLLTATWLKDKAPATPGTWYSRNYVRDTSTGWVTSAFDTAGVETRYGYDSIGRVTSITPQTTEVATSISYPSTTQTTATRTAGTLTTYQEYDYDGLGRQVLERRLMPSNAYARRFTLFDAAGNAYFASEWVADSTAMTISTDPGPSCAFSGGSFSTSKPSNAPGEFRHCFDPFGRPQEIVGAGHSSVTTISRNDGSTFYSDILESVSNWCVNGTRSGVSCSGGISPDPVTTRVKDAFGRLTSVTEPGGEPATTYGYNVAGKLTSVSQGAGDIQP
jgi:YD repeat-containing protein